MTSTQSESKPAPRAGAVNVAIWLSLGIAITGVTALLASHAPPRLRLIGILAGLQGAACGWLVSLAGTRLKMRSPTASIAGGLIFGSASVALTTVLWWQANASQLKADYKPPRGAAMAMAILNQAKESTDAKMKKEMDEYREALKSAGALPPDTSFPAYLEFRVSALTTSRLGGQILFGVELLFAGLLCACFARASVRRPFCESCCEWTVPIRRHEFIGETAQEVAELVGGELPSCVSAAVVLSQCRCEGRRPDVLVLLESADRKDAVRRSSTDTESPLSLSDETFTELTTRIDAAQGLR